MEYSYKFRIYPNQEQIIQIHKTFGCVRFIYNHYLSERIKLYQDNKTNLNYHACSKTMTALKKELAWLYKVDFTALQASLLEDYQGDLILADINYERETKTHQCEIEKVVMK